MARIIVSLSGGLDSTTVLGKALRDGHEVVKAISFHYGSKHNPYENESARKVAKHLKVPYELLLLKGVMGSFKSNLMKGGGKIPKGHYQAESMKQTVVPARNIIFCAVLTGHAESTGASEVWVGMHAGDHAIYPDCRPDFVAAMKAAIGYGTDNKVTLVAPFLNITKAQILSYGMDKLKNPEKLYALTRTCYTDKKRACGKCGSCQERLESFYKLGKDDPIEYKSRELLPKLPKQGEKYLEETNEE